MESKIKRHIPNSEGVIGAMRLGYDGVDTRYISIYLRNRYNTLVTWGFIYESKPITIEGTHVSQPR